MGERNLGAVAKDVYCLYLPNPLGEPTNVYLFWDERPTLIDAGHNAPSSYAALETCLKQLGLQEEDVSQVIYTHPHLDHIGGSIFFPPSTLQISYQGALKGPRGYFAYVKAWQQMVPYFAAKYPELTEELEEPSVEALIKANFTASAAQVRVGVEVKEGEEISLGKNILQVFFAPGHNLYHLLLYAPAQRLLFGGDFLLAHGPAVINLSGGDPRAYQKSLTRFQAEIKKGLKIKQVLPGHGTPFFDPLGAVEAALERLKKQCLKVTGALRGGPKTIREIISFFFGGEYKAFPGTALGVVDTFLTCLIEEGLVDWSETKEGKKFYLRKKR